MEDDRIIELYWERDEAAIVQTQRKYGRYCYAIARNVLHNHEEAEESVNDTYLGAWNAMPPHRPAVLSVFLGKITRQLSLKKLRGKMAQKRGGGETAVALEELEECIPAGQDMDTCMDAKEQVLDLAPPDDATTQIKIQFMQGEYVVTVYTSDCGEAWKLIETLR